MNVPFSFFTIFCSRRLYMASFRLTCGPSSCLTQNLYGWLILYILRDRGVFICFPVDVWLNSFSWISSSRNDDVAKLSVPNSFRHKLKFSPLFFGDRQIKHRHVSSMTDYGGGGGGQVFCFLYVREGVDLWTFTLFISLAFREITDVSWFVQLCFSGWTWLSGFADPDIVSRSPLCWKPSEKWGFWILWLAYVCVRVYIYTHTFYIYIHTHTHIYIYRHRYIYIYI